MPEYRRNRISGGTYFFTVVTANRRPWLCEDVRRRALRRAIDRLRTSRPFEVDAWVLLPEHLHCIWTLPDGDADYSTRWRLIKDLTTRGWKRETADPLRLIRPTARYSGKDQQNGEAGAASPEPLHLWQPRYWEHAIRDDADFRAHCDYIHYNPVKHGLCGDPMQWRYTTVHRFLSAGVCPPGWGTSEPPLIADPVGRE